MKPTLPSTKCSKRFGTFRLRSAKYSIVQGEWSKKIYSATFYLNELLVTGLYQEIVPSIDKLCRSGDLTPMTFCGSTSMLCANKTATTYYISRNFLMTLGFCGIVIYQDYLPIFTPIFTDLQILLYRLQIVKDSSLSNFQ